jgi:hypothetical protein
LFHQLFVSPTCHFIKLGFHQQIVTLLIGN